VSVHRQSDIGVSCTCTNLPSWFMDRHIKPRVHHVAAHIPFAQAHAMGLYYRQAGTEHFEHMQNFTELVRWQAFQA